MKKLRFSKGARKLSEKQIAAVESELGVTLPPDYREFLRTQNGGVPKPDRYATQTSEHGRVQFFYSARTGDPFNDLTLLIVHLWSELALPGKYVPVALLDCDDVLLLKVTRPHGVYEWIRIEEGFNKEHLTKVASGFSAFLDSLTDKPQLSPTSDPGYLYTRAIAAIRDRNQGKLRELIAAGCDLNYKPEDDWHLVVLAAHIFNAEALRILLEHGADRNAVDNNDVPVQQLAREALDLEIHCLKIKKSAKMKTALTEERVKQAQEVLDILSSKEP